MIACSPKGRKRPPRKKSPLGRLPPEGADGSSADAEKSPPKIKRPSVPNKIFWRWQSDAKLDIQSLELTDALTLRLIETSLRPLLPASVLKALEPRLQNAAEKLDASIPTVSGWANKVASVLPMVPFIPPKIDPKVLETVQDCLLKDFAITCRYRSVAAEKPKELKLHPLGLVQRGPVTYLIATAFHYEEPRPFALHRMSAVQNTYETVKRPKGFSLKQFIDDGGMGFGEATPINLVAKDIADAGAGTRGNEAVGESEDQAGRRLVQDRGDCAGYLAVEVVVAFESGGSDRSGTCGASITNSGTPECCDGSLPHRSMTKLCHVMAVQVVANHEQTELILQKTIRSLLPALFAQAS